MEIIYIALTLSLLAFFAHIIKGITGFGPAIVFVSIGTLIYNPIDIIVLASLLDIIGGSYLTALNPKFLQNKKYWMPIGALMVVGAITGGLLLSIVPAKVFEYILGIAIVLIALWFLIGDSEPPDSSRETHTLQTLDGIVGFFAGFCGGFTGMGGPPLIAYLGPKFKKDLFRAIIVPIFLVASISRFSTYGVLGMINLTEIWIYILPPLGVLAGNYVGNKLFDHIQQKWFTICVGVILLFSGLKLLI